MLFDFEETPSVTTEIIREIVHKPELPESIQNIADRLSLLYGSKKLHHAILLPSFYSIESCKLIVDIIKNITGVFGLTISHPDIFYLDEYREQKNSTSITVEEVRDLISFALKSPSVLDAKFIILK